MSSDLATLLTPRLSLPSLFVSDSLRYYFPVSVSTSLPMTRFPIERGTLRRAIHDNVASYSLASSVEDNECGV